VLIPLLKNLWSTLDLERLGAIPSHEHSSQQTSTTSLFGRSNNIPCLAFAALNVSVRTQLNGASAWTYLQPKSWISGHSPVGSVNLSPQSPYVTLFLVSSNAGYRGSDNTNYLSLNRASLGALSAFLLEHGLTTQQTIYVSFGCAKTIQALLNFNLALDLFSLGNHCVILSLDTVCTDAANANGILSYDGFASENVNARSKELSQPGRKVRTSPGSSPLIELVCGQSRSFGRWV